MGDRTTPMKFGPEWLRNMSRPASPGTPGSGGGAQTTPPNRPVTSIATTSSNKTTPPNTSKVLLAKLRYGREEMLALYDRQTVEAPPQLKSIELYQPRGKPPYALNNNFEDDTRDSNMRNNPPIGGMIPPDRYGQGRGRGLGAIMNEGRGRGLGAIMNEGRGRGMILTEARGRARGFVRPISSDTFRSLSWHNGGQRSYSGAPDDDPNPTRMWNNGNGNNPPGIRPCLEQAEWANKAPYRKNRQNNTNWRQQQNRDEGEEWRSSDGARRGQEKWEREWPERSAQDKPWTTNRRQWSGDNNEDSLPEWAVENSEACGGTFDSSGAFHGYSNDDSSIPKAQEPSFPLARSHTQGSFARSKTFSHPLHLSEERSDEWWASEKAKKLNTVRFDSVDDKFKKKISISEEGTSGNASATSTSTAVNTTGGKPEVKPKLVPRRIRSTSPDSHDYCTELQDEAAALPAKLYDDNKMPKAQASSHPLARSHTHGSFAHSKTAEESSEDCWASEKSKKQYCVRFYNDDYIFKPDISTSTNTAANTPVGIPGVKPKLVPRKIGSTSPATHDYSTDLQDEAAALPAKREEEKHDDDKPKDKTYQTSYVESTQPSGQQRIDMRRQTEELDSDAEIGSYKSVMMTPNNNPMRQKHQIMGAPTNDPPKRIPHLYGSAKQQQQQEQARQHRESGEENQQKQHETKLVEDFLDMNLNEEIQVQLLDATSQGAGMNNQMPSSPRMQMQINKPLLNQSLGMTQQNATMASPTGMLQGSVMRPVGLTNPMSLGQSMGTGSNIGMPLTNMPPAPITNSAMLSSSLQGMGAGNIQNPMQGMQAGLLPSGMQGMQSGMQGMQTGMQGMQTGMQGMQTGMQGMQSGMQGPGMQGNVFQHSGGIPGNMQLGNLNNNLQAGSGMAGFQGVGNTSLFMQGSPNTIQNPNEGDLHASQNLFPMHGHGLQQSASQGSFNAASMYGNMIQQPTAGPLPNVPLTEQWYYKDPKKTIQGPFTTTEMCNWYRAGFFSPDLMVRRACESGLRPLINYGIMPFGPMVESLWGQPSNDMIWMQPRDENNRINSSMSMYFWDQPTGMSNPLLPDVKDMKTEDDILAQMRASQADPAIQNLTFMSDAVNPEDAFTAGTNIAPNLEELQKLIEGDFPGPALRAPPAPAAANAKAPSPILHHVPSTDKEKKTDKALRPEPIPEVSANQQEKVVEVKVTKQTAKVEEKAKVKEVATTKTKTKKQKEDKKDDSAEVKMKEEKKTAEFPIEQEGTLHFGSWFHDNVISRIQERSFEMSLMESKIDKQKRTEEPLPPKNKKEDKANKKELDKEKKEWLKDGFTIVKGAEKKDNKKKEKEETRAAEEAEKKRKEEEKRALLEAEKNRAPEPVTRRQQMQEIGQAQRQQAQAHLEQVLKKAPWSAPAPPTRDGLALSDIQRLEKEKKLEQMREQQHMMQVIAQQQAIAAQREQQEIHPGQLGWAKQKKPNNAQSAQTFAEIQAETRLQALGTTTARDEVLLPTLPPINIVPWGTTNGGGFWDSPVPSAGEPSSRSDTRATEKPKKRVTVVTPPKKELSPSADFDSWCTNILSNWRDAANIDIPTFVTFLRDIESPYEVKDYVKCYLGDTKESADFSRQFLERRSRLLRVGMVTPSDDLCSPAAAITPRTNSGSDYTEVKSKGKKTKKNKMFKVDARILGFSVTASEDRINIGDIDTV